jgi:hypothetical protein
MLKNICAEKIQKEEKMRRNKIWRGGMDLNIKYILKIPSPSEKHKYFATRASRPGTEKDLTTATTPGLVNCSRTG